MKTSIIPVGNSKGVRLPKVALDESGLGKDVELIVKRGEIKIIPARKEKVRSISETALLSEAVLAKDWLRPEEDKAWAAYQSDK